MVGSQSATLPVEWSHLESANPGLADLIADDHLRLDGALRAAVADFVAAHAPEYAVTEVRIVFDLIFQDWKIDVKGGRGAPINRRRRRRERESERKVAAKFCVERIERAGVAFSSVASARSIASMKKAPSSAKGELEK